jgi:hypothetical protein
VSADGPARLLLLGGEPFAEEIVMWWNFIGRSHDDIVTFRDDWAADVADPAAVAVGSAGGRAAGGRFGPVAYEAPPAAGARPAHHHAVAARPHPLLTR